MAVYFEMQNMTTGVALDEATFPDAAFRTLLAETADVNGDSRLSALELRHVSELNCSNLGIADLTGIEYFTALVALNCENNKLTALDVSKNTHLSEIYCGGNQLATLDLTGLPIKDAETDTGHVQTLPGSYALTGTENGVGLFDLSQIVGKDNIGSITAVKGASYDKEAGIARYSAAVEKPSYTYATGSSAVSLTVSFSLDMSTMPKSPFTDVVAGSWYFDAALYASSHNLMLGTSPTEFSPNITMTRGMLVTVLYRMNGSPSVSGKTPFTGREDRRVVLRRRPLGLSERHRHRHVRYHVRPDKQRHARADGHDPLPLHENGRPGQGQSLRRPERFCRRGQRE